MLQILESFFALAVHGSVAGVLWSAPGACGELVACILGSLQGGQLPGDLQVAAESSSWAIVVTTNLSL